MGRPRNPVVLSKADRATVQQQRRVIAKTAHDYPLIGSALLRHRSTRGRPMSFRWRPFLVELYADLAHGGKVGPRDGVPGGADIVSAPQTGKSDLFIQMAIHEAGWEGRFVAYVLPTQGKRNDFVTRRINTHLQEVPAYRARLPGGDEGTARIPETGNMKTKRLGSGMMLFLGANTDTDWVEFSADTMILDEYDLCWEASFRSDGTVGNLDKANDRLREGREPRLFRLGNPEIARGGMEALWAAGDQRDWHFRCGHCGERQAIEWDVNIARQEDSGRWALRDRDAVLDPDAPVRPVCRRCARPFDRDPAGACWVPASLVARRRSYRISRFDAIDQPIRPAWEEFLEALVDTQKMRGWRRGWEGRAWEPASARLTREDIVDAAVLGTNDPAGGDAYSGAMTMGVDVGAVLNVIVSRLVRGAGGRTERRAVFVATVGSFEQVLDVAKRYRVRTAVVDARPETRKAQELRDDLKRVGIDCWLCQFSPSARADREEFAMRLDQRARVVTVDRTQLLDVSADACRAGAALGRALSSAGLRQPPVWTDLEPAVRAVALAPLPDPGIDGVRLWPSDVDTVLGFTAQMRAPQRLLKENGTIVWDERGQPDHFRLTDAYDLLAMKLDGRGGSFF